MDMSLGECDLIVDAIFGTGVRGSVKGLEAGAIDAINSSGKTVISVDVPSGLGTNKVVRADVVVTFHRPKPDMTGNVVVADIGIPPSAEFFVGPGDLWLMGKRTPGEPQGRQRQDSGNWRRAIHRRSGTLGPGGSAGRSGHCHCGRAQDCSQDHLRLFSQLDRSGAVGRSPLS